MPKKSVPIALTAPERVAILDAIEVQIDAYRDEEQEAETAADRKDARAQLRLLERIATKIRGG